MWGKLKEAFGDEPYNPNQQQDYTNYVGHAVAHSAHVQPHASRFASMSMHSIDALRFVNMPTNVIDRCREVVNREWASNKGIKKEREYGGSWEFGVHGYPWQSNVKEDATAVRRMICGLFHVLHTEGWVIHVTTDISKKEGDKDMMVFRNQQPPPPECDWACISFSSYNKLRFIDFPPEVYGNMVTHLASIMKVEKQSLVLPGVFEYKFDGLPWAADGRESMAARRLLLALIEGLDAEGWTIYTSMDHKAEYSEHSSEADTWYCCRPKGWTRGAPSYFR